MNSTYLLAGIEVQRLMENQARAAFDPERAALLALVQARPRRSWNWRVWSRRLPAPTRERGRVR
ncbi:hypothetical protein [Phytoactinopolyspora mesophila]|uniref:Uncharacterized protein n=1 Tax=Phytoactinopolyspora mesophila TaxID=2650750 RepID=A0A7K3M162_9ACTN|nr:hypothetical protein [Phytoactinopolyspora mesophila]NDL56178.1 hypothetical protein [Phytoactinopolyspora mesophila]